MKATLLFIFKLTVILLAIYTAAVMFDYIPEKYAPRALYSSFKEALYVDSHSRSATSDLSKDLYSKLNDADKKDSDKEETSVGQEIVNTIKTPIDKAKTTVDDFNQKQQDQKKMLDEL